MVLMVLVILCTFRYLDLDDDDVEVAMDDYGDIDEILIIWMM